MAIDPKLKNTINDPRLWWVPSDIKAIPAVMLKILSTLDDDGNHLPSYLSAAPVRSIPPMSAMNLDQVSHIQYSKHVPHSVAAPDQRVLYKNPAWVPPTDCNPDALSAWNVGDPLPANARTNLYLSTLWNAGSAVT
jgi:hypothetical protein